jgi:amino acid transporter
MSAAFIALGFMNASKSSSSVFDDLFSLATDFAGLNWLAILVSHIGFYRGLARQNVEVSELPYVGFMQLYASYYALAITATVLFFNGQFSTPGN